MDIREKYYNWLRKESGLGLEYSRLLLFLFRTLFEPPMEMDVNRQHDGIDLRYRFAYENDISPGMVNDYLMDDDCSYLEMMIALALRIQENMFNDDQYGVAFWIREMISCSGLEELTDQYWHEGDAKAILYRIKTHNYQPNGIGGLFFAPDGADMRTLEIWYQMHEHINFLERNN